MPENKDSVVLYQQTAPVQQDRATIVITCHYQEWDPANTTSATIAYDRLLTPEHLPHQQTMRLNPGTRYKVPLGECVPGQCEVALAHDVPKLIGENKNEMLEQAQKQNRIRIFNADGVFLGMIYPGRGCFFPFAGDVFVESTHATALLKITVFPV